MICVICKRKIDKYDQTGMTGFQVCPSYGSKYDGAEIWVHCCTRCTDKLIQHEHEYNIPQE